MSMIRYQMFMDEGQKRILEKMHRKLNVPVAELVRKAIDSFITEQKSAAEYPQADEQVNALLSLAGVCGGGPDDLADSHEMYLRGDLNR